MKEKHAAVAIGGRRRPLPKREIGASRLTAADSFFIFPATKTERCVQAGQGQIMRRTRPSSSEVSPPSQEKVEDKMDRG